MTFVLGHIVASVTSIAIASFLIASGLSVRFRWKLARNENERAFNFRIVGLFLYSLSLDLGIAAIGVNHPVHLFAVSLAAVVGCVATGAFIFRVAKRWN